MPCRLRANLTLLLFAGDCKSIPNPECPQGYEAQASKKLPICFFSPHSMLHRRLALQGASNKAQPDPYNKAVPWTLPYNSIVETNAIAFEVLDIVTGMLGALKDLIREASFLVPMVPP